jgi:hypothetical protein
MNEVMYIANIFAQDHTVKSGGRLHRVRMERLSPVYFFVFHVYKQSSSDNRVPLEMEYAATFFSSPGLNSQSPVRAIPHTIACFIWGSTVVAAIKTASAR